MAKPRVTATDRLSNVIEVVELGQRTGLLTVERGSGSVQEEGEIYFVSGRAVYASLAGLRGREALAGLSRWGACRFAFDKDAPRPSSNLTPIPGALRGPDTNSPPTPYGPGASRPSGTGRLPEGSGAWNVHPDGVNGATSQGGYAAPYTPYSGASSVGMPAQGYPPPAAPGFGGIAGMRDPAAARPPAPPQPAPGTHPLNAAQGFLARRPRRAPDVRDLMTVVSTHNLSRGHRTLLLLADGEHNVLDLARLSSKSVDEVSTLLNELEMRGLIYYYA
jgi:Domain of unknown function (DUF4388)